MIALEKMSISGAVPVIAGIAAVSLFMRPAPPPLMANAEFNEGARPVAAASSHGGVRRVDRTATFSAPAVDPRRKFAVDPSARSGGLGKKNHVTGRSFVPVHFTALTEKEELPLYQSMTEKELRENLSDPAFAEAYVHEYEGEHTSRVMDNSFHTLKILHAHQLAI